MAGNHDFDVLARLADQFTSDQFTLLGRGGTWERTVIEEDGRLVLSIDGWSFPCQRVCDSPLASYDLRSEPSAPILGIVHGDLDTAVTSYATLELARLQSLPPAGWLLGHIHACRLTPDDGKPWVLYPGSPQALDPGETGPHGPWVVEIDGGRLGRPQHRPLSTVWYGHCEIDLTSTTNEGDVESVVLRGIRDEAERVVSECGPQLTAVILRLSLVGSTPVAPKVRLLAEQVVEDLSLTKGSATVCVESIDVETVPLVDLAEYAKTQSAPGILARLLLELDRGETSREAADLLHQAKTRLEEVVRDKDFTALPRQEVSEQVVDDLMQSEARALLTQLVSQTA